MKLPFRRLHASKHLARLKTNRGHLWAEVQGEVNAVVASGDAEEARLKKARHGAIHGRPPLENRLLGPRPTAAAYWHPQSQFSKSDNFKAGLRSASLNFSRRLRPASAPSSLDQSTVVGSSVYMIGLPFS